jgi:hypothetical protein
MFVHKYVASNDTFYRVSSDPNPEKPVTLKGKPLDSIPFNRVDSIIGNLNKKFKEEPKEEESKKEEKTKKVGLVSLADKLKATLCKLYADNEEDE